MIAPRAIAVQNTHPVEHAQRAPDTGSSRTPPDQREPHVATASVGDPIEGADGAPRTVVPEALHPIDSTSGGHRQDRPARSRGVPARLATAR
jgi:hypothetical protein